MNISVNKVSKLTYIGDYMEKNKLEGMLNQFKGKRLNELTVDQTMTLYVYKLGLIHQGKYEVLEELNDVMKRLEKDVDKKVLYRHPLFK